MSLQPRLVRPVERRFPADESACPNHPTLPVLIYEGAFDGASNSLADAFEAAFRDNGWTGCWRWSVYPYHHFHSNAHEALGVSRGRARLQLGGPQGEAFEVSAGMLIVLPAGTGHKNMRSSPDFLVVGAYPEGQGHYDTHRLGSMDYDRALVNIKATPMPETDPLYGSNGPLVAIWNQCSG